MPELSKTKISISNNNNENINKNSFNFLHLERTPKRTISSTNTNELENNQKISNNLQKNNEIFNVLETKKKGKIIN